MKNTNKLKAIGKIVGVIAIIAVIGLSMAACSDTTSGGGGPGSALVGRWYSDKATADGVAAGKGIPYDEWVSTAISGGSLPPDAVCDMASYEFTSKGRVIVAERIESSYEATATQIRATGSSWADYTISGKVLTLSNTGGSGFTAGTYYKAR